MKKEKNFLDVTRPWLTEKLVAWPILPSVYLEQESAFSIKAFGLPLILVRGKDGKVSVHIDRCPHRHVSFFTSGMAPPVQGNTFTCNYHEQVFDQSGQCIRSHHDEHVPKEHLVNLSVFEANSFIWIPVNAAMFRQERDTELQEQELENIKQSIRIPSEFTAYLSDSDRYDCLPLFTYLYPKGSWPIVISSGIDHTHGFKVHKIARVVHRIRHLLAKETLSGMHMICNDDEKSVLVTYKQYSKNLEAYWKVGGAPNLWLNKLGDGIYIAVIFVPETNNSTRIYGEIFLGSSWRFLLENHPMMAELKQLSIQNSIEDRPYIESQSDYLKIGQLPVGHASMNDAPVYRFFKYFEEIASERIDFHAKPHITDMLSFSLDDG